MTTENFLSDIGHLDDTRILNIGGATLTLGGLVSGAIILAIAVLIALKALGLGQHLPPTKSAVRAEVATPAAPAVNDAAADLLKPSSDPVESEDR